MVMNHVAKAETGNPDVFVAEGLVDPVTRGGHHPQHWKEDQLRNNQFV